MPDKKRGRAKKIARPHFHMVWEVQKNFFNYSAFSMASKTEIFSGKRKSSNLSNSPVAFNYKIKNFKKLLINFLKTLDSVK